MNRLSAGAGSTRNPSRSKVARARTRWSDAADEQDGPHAPRPELGAGPEGLLARRVGAGQGDDRLGRDAEIPRVLGAHLGLRQAPGRRLAGEDEQRGEPAALEPDAVHQALERRIAERGLREPAPEDDHGIRRLQARALREAVGEPLRRGREGGHREDSQDDGPEDPAETKHRDLWPASQL